MYESGVAKVMVGEESLLTDEENEAYHNYADYFAGAPTVPEEK